MAGGDGINFRIGGDASAALAANDKLRRSNEEVNQSFDQGAKVSQTAANRIIRNVETQQERFKRLRSEIYRGWEQSKLSTEQYGRAIRQLEKDYKTNEGAFKKFADTTKIDFQEMEEGAGGFGKAIAAWGPRLAGAIGLMSTLRQGYQEIEQIISKSGEGIVQGRATIGQLRQLANTQEEFDELQNAARRLYLSGATESLGEAAGAVFSLSSAGLLDRDSEKLFLQLGARQVVPDLGTFARAIRTQLAAFGEGETGGAVQIASKAFAASAFSPASVEELLEAASLPGGTARSLGISDEEVLAATALLATSTGSANVGATALRSFLSSTAQREEFSGKSIFERVQMLKDKNLSVAQLLQSPSDGGLGRKEAVRAFTDLESQLGQLQQVTSVVNAANYDTTAIDRKLGFFDPINEAARLKFAAKAQAEFQTENLAARRLITDAIEQREKAEAISRNGSTIGSAEAALLSLGSSAFRLIGGQAGEELLFARGGGTSTEGERETIDALKRMPEILEKQNQIMEKLLGEQVAEQKETNQELKKKDGITVTNE